MHPLPPTCTGYLLFYPVADATEHELPAAEEANLFFASVFFCTFILINGFMLEELFIGMLVRSPPSGGAAVVNRINRN